MEAEEEEEEAEMVDGHRLVHSSKSSTGYLGVYASRGRFEARPKIGGKRIQVGSYSTAVEAAVAIAKRIATAGGEEEEEAAMKEAVDGSKEESNEHGEGEEEAEEPASDADGSEEESDEEEKEPGQCGTPGCTLADFHAGPCSSWLLASARKRGRAKDTRFVWTT